MVKRFTLWANICLVVCMGALWPLEAQEQKEGKVTPAAGSSKIEDLGFDAIDPKDVPKDIDDQLFQPGNYIKLTTLGDQKIMGTIVRRDKNKKSLFLRKNSGLDPVEIDLQNVKAALVMRYGGKTSVNVAFGPKEGNLLEKFKKLPPGPSGNNFNEMEITRREFMHGTTRTIHYFAPNLSFKEKAQLIVLENAENNLLRAEEQVLFTATIRQEEVAIRREQRRQEELLSQLLYRALIAPPALNRTNAGLPSDYIMAVAAGLQQPKDNGMLKTIQTETPNFLAKAKDDYKIAWEKAVFEDNRIVAVVAD